MPAHLDHTVVPAHDKEASAEFLAGILGLKVGTDPYGYFAPVELGNDVFLEFADSDDFRWNHYAFLVSEEEFDAAFARIMEAGLDYHAGPMGARGEIYFHSGGRGVYFDDPNGHVMELTTAPSSSIGPDTAMRTGPYRSARGDLGKRGAARKGQLRSSTLTTADSDRAPVTVIGLGVMGTALATTFLDNGHPTTVWNRSAGKVDELVANGAVRAVSAADAVAATPLVVLCVMDHKAVLEILDSVGEAVSGRVLVNLTTGTPDQAREAARWASERGAEYLDGGILADPEQIGTAAARLYYSGSPDAFEAHQATLKVLGEAATYYGADAGLAAVYVMALIGLSYEIWIAYLHTLVLVGAENIDAMTFAPSAAEMLTPTIELLTEMARAVDEGHYPAVAGPLSTHAALMDDLVNTWQARDIDVERLKHVQSLVERRVAEGHGGDGFSSLIEPIKKQRKDLS